jgi:hypothetical protein
LLDHRVFLLSGPEQTEVFSTFASSREINSTNRGASFRRRIFSLIRLTIRERLPCFASLHSEAVR